MTPDQFDDSISKGLGRVIANLRIHPSEPYMGSIERACTRNLAYDAQCEESRAGYLFEIMELTGQMDRLAAGVVEVLRTSEEIRDLWQAYALAARQAEAGHQDARTAMYERFERSRQDPPEGMDAIVALDRENGLLSIMRSLGRRILAGETLPLDAYLLSVAKHHLGEDVCERVLVPAAQEDPAVRACLDTLDEASRREQERSQKPGRHRSLEGKTYTQVKEALEAAQGKLYFGALRRWGKSAADSELIAAALDALKETRPAFLLSYLKIFFDRPFPLDIGIIIQIADTGEAAVAHAALCVLAAIENPQVRAFGLDLLQRGHRLANAFGLFRLNSQPGDHVLFMNTLARVSRADEAEVLHGIGLDLLHVFGDPISPECRDPLLWVYENTPCSNCRNGAVEILIEARQMPEDILRECLDDCDPHTRELARMGLGSDRG